MAHLTWLHLSDWHQRGQDFDRKVVRDQLIKDIRNRRSIDSRLTNIDLVVFTGDLAFSGLSQEFKAARENLLDPVLEAAGLTPDRLFIVPGNHDLQRSVISEMSPPDLQTPLDSEELVSKWLTDERKRQRALEPFEAYTEFVEDYTRQVQPAFASVKQLTIRKIEVALLGLNSAWMCGRHRETDGEINDYGFIVVGEPQIHDALRQISNATIRIALLHHPFRWLKGFEQSKIEKRLKEACHFILRGHEHEPDADWSTGPQGECMVIPAGASYERRRASDPRYVNSYNFLHLDLDAGQGVVFFRKWGERRTAWIEDTDSCSGGQLNFVLPKRLTSPKTHSLSADAHVEANLQLTTEADYRRQTIEAFKNLSFKGLTASVRPILLPLERVYVQLRAVAEVPESADEFTPEERRVLRWMDDEREALDRHSPELREAQMRLDALRRERWTKERLERFPIAEALKDPKRRGLVILGDPGSGKTTLLHFLALIFARGPEVASEHLKLTRDEADRLPIFAPLAAYDDMLNYDPNLTVQSFLAKYYEKRRAMPGLSTLFDAAIEQGRALVLLDGMDEVLEEGRRKFVADQASAFIRALIHRGNRVLLTSRIYGYRVAPLSVELPHVTVLDFRREEIETFARHWNHAMAEWEYADRSAAERLNLARDEERALLNEIKSNAGVERLAANPLLLSMLALLRRQVGTLPQQRIRLYDLYLRTLIDAWEASRSPGARVDLPVRPGAGKVELILIPLALWLQQNKPSGTATEAEILAQMRGVFLREEGLPADLDQDTAAWAEAQQRARQFLDDMRALSGLLVERGHGAFGFRHLTFQEYYVGRALARMEAGKRWALLRPHLHANRWREPVLLAAAQLGNIQADEEACTTLVNQILDAASPHEDILHRDLFLAADCAGDDINVHILLLRRLVDQLSGLLKSTIPTVITESIRRLVSLVKLSSGEKPRLPELVEILAKIGLEVGHSSIISIDQYIPLVSSLFASFEPIQTAVLERLDSEDSFVRGATIRALDGLLSENAIVREAVFSRLNDRSSFVRTSAIQVLSGLAAQSDPIRQAIVEKLEDTDSQVRIGAINALRDVMRKDDLARQAVKQRLGDHWYGVSAAAFEVLADLVTVDEPLPQYLKDKLNNLEILSTAIKALKVRVFSDFEVRKTIEQSLERPESFLRTAAISALAGLLPDDQSLRQAVTQRLDDDGEGVRERAISALHTFVFEDTDLQKKFLQCLDDPAFNVRAAAIKELVNLPQYEGSVLRLLSHEDWNTRREVVLTLAERLPNSPILASDLSRVLDDLSCLESSWTRAAAIETAAGIMTENPIVLAAIRGKLNDKSIVVRAQAISSLAGLLKGDSSLRAAVFASLEDSSSTIRTAAVRAFTQLLPESQTVRNAIATRLDDDDTDVRTAALISLKTILSQDSDVRDAIRRKLTDKSWNVRVEAIRALAETDHENESWRGAVREILNLFTGYGRISYVFMMAGFLSDYQPIQEALLDMVHDEEVGIRVQAIQFFNEVVLQNSILRQAVIEGLKDPSPSVQAAAIKALAPFLTNDNNLRDLIIEKLDDNEREVRTAAFPSWRAYQARKKTSSK